VSTTATNRDSNVVGLPAQQVERYVSRAELARIMDVSIGTIDNLTREGMPSTTWGRRTRRYRPSTAIAWAQARGKRAA
jgi:phage terminase Nu1 subunit (DNA packaging protein)